ncbi:MAG: RNA polymerase factor sigma-54 [Deltaproteobacteria bacterium]|nr:RNA polymerase factor sigma-54 [Deltaproteobacteria bacterium]
MPLDLKQTQTQRLLPELRITLQLQQAIKLLQLSRYELAQEILEQLEENPILEERLQGIEKKTKPGDLETATPAEAKVPEGAGTPADGDGDAGPGPESGVTPTEEEFAWDRYFDSYINSRQEGAFGRASPEEVPVQDRRLHTRIDLREHLMWQLRLSDFDDEERSVGVFVIGNLNEDGLLMRDEGEDVVGSIAAACESDSATVERVIKRMQQFDPVGVVSRDVRECLLAQARHFAPTNRLIHEILEKHYDDLQKMKFASIARALGTDVETVKGAIRVISRFDTRPGRLYSTTDPHYITPDIYIEKVGGEWKIIINEEGVPRIRISPYYRAYLRKRTRDATSRYIREKLNAAKWFMDSIAKRRQTMFKVMEAILKLQRDFFDHGVEHLKPLYLKDVAQEIGMHEATVCRVTTSKYVHTPQGLFELKYFFSSGLGTADGADVSSKAVKSKITRLLAQEEGGRTLSDREIVAILAQEGIRIARRTVAKYRGQMGIMSSAKRKKMQ